ncbi:kynurenine/alpha-aminoadipate aminotransferase, mitochondrial-like isoform X6 [Lissotriton helveticus]
MSDHADAQPGIADINYSRFLNSVSAARQQSTMKSLGLLISKSPPSLINLCGGVPNSSTYPFKKASITMHDGSIIEIEEHLMKIALNYSLSQGVPDLVSWLKDLQIRVHNPPTVNYSPEKGQMELCITNGCLEGLSKVFEMLVSPGDNILVSDPVFEGALRVLKPLGCNIIGVPSDNQGIIPRALKEVLSKWRPEDVRKPESRSPKFLYTVPTGGNPIGMTLSTERKKAIYQIAREYDFLIVEDDPYFYLQFTKPLAPSFLSMDVDGRVLRADSMSKVISPGEFRGLQWLLEKKLPQERKLMDSLRKMTVHSRDVIRSRSWTFVHPQLEVKIDQRQTRYDRETFAKPLVNQLSEWPAGINVIIPC